MRVFVAGATGVLGRKAAGLLVEAGHEVRGTARGPAKAELLRNLGAEPVSVDLFDGAAVRRALEGSEAVLHLATKIPPIMKMRSRKNWAENDRLRREGTKNLVDGAIAAGAHAFIAESVTFIYRDAGDRWIDESAPTHSPWAALDSTFDLEREALRFADHGRAVVLRFGLFYSPEAQSTQDSLRMMRRRMFGVMGDGANYFSSVHVDDAAAAVVAALGAPTGVYNVVEDEPVTQLEYAATFAGAFGAPKPRRFPRWLGRIVIGGPANYILQSQRVSNRKFKETTGWSPQYPSVREGFRQAAEVLGALP